MLQENQENIFEDIIEVQNSRNLKLLVPSSHIKSQNNIKSYQFQFENIYDLKSTQTEIFSNLQELIQSVLDGQKVCIFAYGPTGSGKTYTMQGEEDYCKWGIIPRSIEYIYQEMEKMKPYEWNYKIRISLSEIYNEILQDLIHKEVKKEEVKDILIEGGPQQIMGLLKQGYEKRKTSETECNDYSSRSHFIFQMKIDGFNSKKNSSIDQPLIQGVLNLIDLAGSERLSLSKAEGDRLKETQNINKSLTALGNVITSLSKQETFIPYRNSKLTYYLQDYLGGNSKTLMMVNISPSYLNFHQTLCTLKFAEKVKCCKNNNPQKYLDSNSSPYSRFNSFYISQRETNISLKRKEAPFKNVIATNQLRNTTFSNIFGKK